MTQTPKASPPAETRELVRELSTWHAWWPVTIMMACSLLSYMDRLTLGVLSPMILSELRLDGHHYGQIVASFNYAYMLANPIWGSILDRIGLRKGMALAVAIWSMASGAHAAVVGFLGFLVARAVLGFGEAATFPDCMRAAMDWLPSHQQSRGIAVAYSGLTVGGIVTPLLVTPIALAYGWRVAFIVTGAVGLLWVLLWRGSVNFSAAVSARQTERITLPNPSERRFWSLVASYALGALPFGFVQNLAPLYLAEALGFTQAQLGKTLWLAYLGGIGYFFWGWIIDRFAANNRRPSWLFFTLTLCGLPLIAVPYLHNATVVLCLMFWATFVAVGFVILSLRTSAFAYPKEQSGVVAGIGSGSWSAVVALVMPSLGHMFDLHHYANAFLFVGMVPAVGTFCWWALTLPREPDRQ
jgi:MFS transporter, ACS family, hexuronate transporter